MTRENKLALVVGFGLILFVGILITDHLAADTRGHETLPTARIPDAGPITLAGRGTTILESEAEPARVVEVPIREPEIVLELSSGDRPLARQMRPIGADDARTVTDGALAGRGMATPPPPSDRIHVVQKNETLSSIAKSVYGDAGLWKRIQNANPKVDARRLRPGTRLMIPSSDQTSTRRAASREVPEQRPQPASTRPYSIRSGDSLAKIASRELGSEGRLREIKDLNGMTNDLIVPGQTINLPAR